MEMSKELNFNLKKTEKKEEKSFNNYSEITESIIKEHYVSGREFKNNNCLAEYFRKKRNHFKYFCIFGGGVLGTTLGKWLQKNEITVDYYCDNNTQKQGTSIAGIPFISFERLTSMKAETFVMVSATNKEEGRRYNDEINKQLSDFPFVMPNILKFIAFYVNDYQLSYEEALSGAVRIVDAFADQESKNLFIDLLPLKFIDDAEPYEKNPLEKYYKPMQYFVEDCYKHSPKDQIVDCGAFNGDTLQSFIELYGSDFEQYHCFEMDKNIFSCLEDRVRALPDEVQKKVVLHHAGVHSKSGTAYYNTMTDTLGSILCSHGEEETRLVSLDEELRGHCITLINMDIENSELQALEGAEKLISEQRPMLAISIYHSTEQFFRVPLYVLDNFTSYKLYLRQHTTITDDTVLYAVPY